MEPSPKVTVYIPCHNYGRYLNQAIDSVLGQTYPKEKLELILIDDGSTDQTKSIMRGYNEGRITLIYHDKPKGLIHCANTALELAKGEYIIRLDADDYLQPDAIRCMANVLDRDQSIGVACSYYLYVDANGKMIGENIYVEEYFPYHGSCCLIRKKTLISLRAYPKWLDASDGYWLFKNMAGFADVAIIPYILFNYRKHGNSLSDDTSRITRSRNKINEMIRRNDE